MQDFIYADLLNEPVYSYHKPVLTKVKQAFPDTTVLDLDSFSDDFLVTQACQLLGQATKCVVYFRSISADAKMGGLTRLAEVLIQRQQNSLVIVRGEHNRLTRLFSDRQQVTFLNNPDEQTFTQHLHALFNPG